MTPLTTPELIAIRKQKALGWSLLRIASYWNRSTAELDLILWWMVGSKRKRDMSNTRELVNRRLAQWSSAEPAKARAA